LEYTVTIALIREWRILANRRRWK